MQNVRLTQENRPMSGSKARFLLAGSLIVLLSACQETTAPQATPIDPQFGPGGSKDRGALSAPRNLRITGHTEFTVSLAWDAASDKAPYTYRLVHSRGYYTGVNGNQTTYTWFNLEPGQTYSFWVYAEDVNGNKSGNSNTVTITLPRDTQAPTSPALSLLNIGPTHASLGWPSSDNGPNIFYTVFKDGVAVITGTSATSGTINGLQPSTRYTFTAVARDASNNSSPVSAPLTVTTPAADEPDTTPPAAPQNVTAYSLDGDREVQVYWSPASDNRTPHSMMLYEMWVNGVHENSAIGKTMTTGYAFPGDKIEVFAIDSSGNRSAAGVTIFSMPPL
jgi:chitodextrinase